jgi:DNA-binding IclR family transcriptional regulator
MEQLGTVDKALDVLEHLHREGASCGVSEIGRALDLPRSTVHRVLATLHRRDLVERDAQGRYRPGFALVVLGVGVLEREPVVAAARPVLEAEAAARGETLFLAAPRDGRLRVLDKEEGPAFLRAAPRIGAEIPVHATAIGKVYLAFSPGSVDLSGELDRYTAHTRVSREALAREVALVRRRGFAENREEWIPGLTGVAAPIWLGDRVIAAMAVCGATARIGPRDLRGLSAAVVEGAARIGDRMRGATT